MVTGSPDQLSATGGDEFTISANYSTANPVDETLSGLGLRIHFDSNQVALVGIEQRLESNLIGVDTNPRPDVSNFDNLLGTDQFVIISWADIQSAAWPGVGLTPATLFVARFRALDSFSGETHIGFSAADTAVGYEFEGLPTRVLSGQVDTEAPTVTAPDEITIEATGVETTVSLGTATVVDDIDVGLVATPSPVGPFAVGMHTIVWSVTDSSGKTGAATQNIEVQDTTGPLVLAPNPVSIEAAAPSTAVAIGTASAVDLVDGVTTVMVDNSGPFAVGVTELLWVSADARGNVGFASQTVTVTDTSSPVVSAPADLIAEATGPLTALQLGVAMVNDLASENLSAVPNALGPFPIGITQITWTASDASGNVGSDTQQIQISDTTGPAVTAPDDISIQATGQSTIVDIGQATAIDLVDGIVAAVPDTTGPFPLGVTLITWAASDVTGNRATDVQRVVVSDGAAPVVIAPENITVEATGALTAVNLGEADASDLSDGVLAATPDNSGPFPLGETTVTWSASDTEGNTAFDTQLITIVDTTPPVVVAPNDIEINAEQSLTQLELGQASANDIVGGALTVSPDKNGPFNTGLTEIIWRAVDGAGNIGTAVQRIAIIPRVAFAQNATIAEGQPFTVKLMLEGPPVTYPVEVPFSVAGTATSPDDHDAVPGVFVINQGLEGSLLVNTLQDSLVEDDEVLLLTVADPVNAVVVSRDTFRLTIVENTNLSPLARISISQGDRRTSQITNNGGLVTANIDISDPNGDGVSSVLWTTTPVLGQFVEGNLETRSFQFDPAGLPSGLLSLRVTVMDDGIPILSTTTEASVRILPNQPPLSAFEDQNSNGISDADEGSGDSDGDGVADFEDLNADPASLPLLDSDINRFVITTDPGLKLRLGPAALLSGRRAARVSVEDVSEYGRDFGLGEELLVDELENASGIVDFEIYELPVAGHSAAVVIPLLEPIPQNAEYRKFRLQSGWGGFTEDSANSVASAIGSVGVCPATDSNSYSPGLTVGSNCLRLVIQDGGPNDADGLADGSITDPSGVALKSEPAPPLNEDKQTVKVTGGGSGSSLLILLLLFTGILRCVKLLHPK